MNRYRPQALRTALILLFSIALVVVVTWFAPSLSAALRNMMFRLRGSFSPPTDIVIVAIDDRSLQAMGQRVGPWPWPRTLMAKALEQLAVARPRSIGLDVIYAEPSTAEDDQRLASALSRSGRVVLPAQLYESANRNNGQNTVWLSPLPAFASAAAAVGHAHISPDVDGTAGSIQLSKADDQAHKLWAFSLEVVRVAEQIPVADIAELPGVLRVGAHRIPIRDETSDNAAPGVTVVRPNEMLINYAGPAGTFRYVSIADVIDGVVPAETFRDKIVLIGAVADSMGDSRVVPFMHYTADGQLRRQGGQEMPGVEIHANIIHTMRGGLSFRALPEWLAFVLALAVILLSAITIRWLDGWRQLTILGLILLAILVGSYIAFSRYLLFPPLAALLTGFVAVIPLLLNRSLTASRELDLKLAALVSSQKGFLSSDAQSNTEFIKRQLRFDLPQSLAWKLRAVDDLTTRLLARMSFVNRILSSMGEAVLVADLEGRIVFANREAAQVFGSGQAELVGANLADFLLGKTTADDNALRQAITNIAQGQSAQLEFAIEAAEPRYYSLLLSALVTGADGAGADLSAIPAGNAIGVVALISDITKRVELDRMKTETLQLVSHELRTPLTSIQGLSDVLLKFPVGADDTREMLSTIHAEAVRLGETINRYLDLTRLESGAQILHLSAVNCGQLVADCLRNLAVFAAERRIRLSSQIEPQLPELRADAQLLTQAVSNLLSNAIKYSPPDTEVVVTVHVTGRTLSLSVCDQGLGIPVEARERIFEKFYRLQRDSNSNIVGTGLGLPLVKEIVEQHGGRITLESLPGQGSTFTIHLPLSQQTALKTQHDR